MPLRDSSDRISPGFLRGERGSRLRHGINIVTDALVQLAEMGVKARFPDFAPEDALPLIGRDRRVQRGFVESSASYRIRLKRWLDDWRYAGTPFAIMEQVRGYLTPYTPRMRIVYTTPDGASANWFTLNSDGSRETYVAATSNWNWDGANTFWRSWLIIYSTSGPWDAQPDYDDNSPYAVYGSDQYTYGSTAKPDEVQSIRAIVAERKPQHQVYPNIIVAFDNAIFSPTGSGAGYPDGTWANFGKISGGVSVPSRNQSAIYWDGAT